MNTLTDRELSDQGQVSPSTGAGTGLPQALRRAIFLGSLPLGMLGFILPVYGKEIGADAVQIGLFFSVFSLMMVLLRPLVGVGLDRYGRRPFVLVGLAGYAASMLTFALWGQVWGVVVAHAVQGIAAACLWIAVDAITSDVAGAEKRGHAFGGMGQVSNQGAVLGIFIAIAILMGGLDVGDPWLILFAGYGLAGGAALLVAWRGLPETYAVAPSVERHPISWSRSWVMLLLIAAVTSASGALVGPIWAQATYAVGHECGGCQFLHYPGTEHACGVGDPPGGPVRLRRSERSCPSGTGCRPDGRGSARASVWAVCPGGRPGSDGGSPSRWLALRTREPGGVLLRQWDRPSSFCACVVGLLAGLPPLR